MALQVGTPAPAFSLTNQHREKVSLDDLKGKKVVIAFMPFAFSGICTGEVCELRDNLSQLEGLDANVVVITVDSFFSNAKWAETEGIEFPILADYHPKGEVARAYDTYNETIGCANRTTYFLDADGIVRAVVKSDEVGVARPFADYVSALGSM